MKLLMITNKVKTYALGFKNVLDVFLDNNLDVSWAADFSHFNGDISSIPVKTINVPVNSNPIKKGNKRTYQILKRYIKDGSIDYVYCSTPIGGTIGRLLGKSTGVKVIYAAHGFLFFKGNGRLKNFVFKCHEKYLAKYTDAIITITDEDFKFSKKLKLRNKSDKRFKVNGAGVSEINTSSFNKEQKRKELKLDETDFVIVSAGFLNPNKNQKVIIKAISYLKKKHKFNAKYLVCGDGNELSKLKQLVHKLKVEDNVYFLGFRTDVSEIMHSSDLFVMPSYREGVPRALLEAMNLGIPCLGSDTRGIRELIDAPNGGFVCKPNDYKGFANAILEISKKQDDAISKRNKEISRLYFSEIVKNELNKIIKEIING